MTNLNFGDRLLYFLFDAKYYISDNCPILSSILSSFNNVIGDIEIWLRDNTSFADDMFFWLSNKWSDFVDFITNNR